MSSFHVQTGWIRAVWKDERTLRVNLPMYGYKTFYFDRATPRTVYVNIRYNTDIKIVSIDYSDTRK